MRGRKKGKRAIVLLLLFLAAGFVFQPSRAAEAQCGIWCPSCAKWQENFKGTVPETISGRGKKEITVSCRDCGSSLIKATMWAETAHYNAGTENESSSWWAEYTVKRSSADVVFPQAEARMDGDDDSDNSYRVTADGDVFGASGYGWTTSEIYDQTVAYLSPLFTSLFNCANGEFTWEDWYKSGLSTSASGVKSSPLIKYLDKFGKRAVLQEELTPPVLSVTGDAEVQVYRNGVLTEIAWQAGELKAGDVIELKPVKIAGREYADYTISDNAQNVSWQEGTQTLRFTMPSGEVKTVLSYRTVKELSVELSSLFYETYQKEPYWDGESFNLDCEPPITVENGMLTVKAVLQHDRTLECVERDVTAFTITGGHAIINLGDNPITVSADVLGDGCLLEGSCIVRADSTALKELMEETESETYTELKEFVETLMDNVSDYEKMVEELSNKLEVSETQRAESEKKLAETLAELESLQEKLDKNREQLGEMSAELEEMSAELEELKETLVSMREFLQQITGGEEPDEELLEKAREELEALKENKENLTSELEKMEKENKKLQEKNESLSGTNENLSKNNEKLTDRLEALAEENEELKTKLEKVMNENTRLYEQLNAADKETQRAQGDYEQMKNSYTALQEKNEELGERLAGLLQDNTLLNEKYQISEKERQDWENRYQQLAKEMEEEKAAQKAMEKATERIMEKETVTERKTEAATERKTEAEVEWHAEKETLREWTTREEITTTEAASLTEATDLMETTDLSEMMPSEETKKEEVSYQGIGTYSGRKLLPGIAVVLAAMLLGGGILFFGMEQKELPFKMEKLKNLG